MKSESFFEQVSTSILRNSYSSEECSATVDGQAKFNLLLWQKMNKEIEQDLLSRVDDGKMLRSMTAEMRLKMGKCHRGKVWQQQPTHNCPFTSAGQEDPVQ